MNKTMSSFRLHFANPATTIFMPLGILGIIFAANWGIWWIVGRSIGEDAEARGDFAEGTQWSGAVTFVFVWMLVVAVQAMNRTFPLALGYGATRRHYYTGTVLAFLALSAGWAVILSVLAVLEEVTAGWGLGGRMFSAIYFSSDGPWLRTWYFFVLLLSFFGVGALTGSLYVRWKQYGIVGFFTALAFLAIGGGALIAVTNSWQRVGEFFVSLGFAGVFALLLVPTLVAVAGGYLALRKAPARN